MGAELAKLGFCWAPAGEDGAPGSCASMDESGRTGTLREAAAGSLRQGWRPEGVPCGLAVEENNL